MLSWGHGDFPAYKRDDDAAVNDEEKSLLAYASLPGTPLPSPPLSIPRRRQRSLRRHALRLLVIATIISLCCLWLRPHHIDHATRRVKNLRQTTHWSWQSPSNQGWEYRDLDLGDGKSARSALRAITVRFDGVASGLSAELIASLPVWDPNEKSEHVQKTEMDRQLWFSAELRDETGQIATCHGERYRLKHSHDVVFDVPASFKWPAGGMIDVRIVLDQRDRTVAEFDTTLSRTAIPRSTLAVCSKPVEGDVTPERMLALVEWREHSALMGVEVVHWSARDAKFGKRVVDYNKRTGRRDTFAHLPALQSSAAKPYFDEHILVADCYARYRSATEWMAILDHDEYLALDPAIEWSKAAVYSELDRLPKNSTSAYLQTALVDSKRFPSIAPEQLTAVDRSMSWAEAEKIASLAQTIDSFHDLQPADHFQTIHRTRDVVSASVHAAARLTAQSNDWKKTTRPIPEHTPIKHQPTPGGLRIIHIHETSQSLDVFASYPISQTMINFWRRLSVKIEPLRSLAAK